MADNARGVFITGTDTGVGKTFIACRLIRALESAGLETAVFKPVETGCLPDDGAPVPQDAVQLARASKHKPALDSVCRHRFTDAVSPARAAQLAGVDLRIADLAAACQSSPPRIAIVEGAGGVLSPIAGDGVNADLAVALGFAVIVVAADRLGCINHVLLTLEALAARNLDTIAVALNRRDTAEADCPALDNARELAQHTQAPIVEINHDPGDGRGDQGIRRLAERVKRAVAA